ncbi:hypothetical protein PQR15_34385 [Streptomyces lydicus]|nr:hypothetical protein [Streptomyces lydicus]
MTLLPGSRQTRAAALPRTGRPAEDLAGELAALRTAWRVPGVAVTVVHGDDAAVLVDGTRDPPPAPH